MSELVELMPGFISAKTYEAADGERVTIVVFEDQASHAAWREHPEHRQAQRIGIDRLYAEYSITVGPATYVHRFARPDDV
jgi:heme-degrading monooxygenase HmoA